MGLCPSIVSVSLCSDQRQKVKRVKHFGNKEDFPNMNLGTKSIE